MRKTHVTAEEIRKIFDYSPETGLLKWKNPNSKKLKPGDVAGNKAATGKRIQVRWGGHIYYAHRLAWLHFYGTWPQHSIDHINGNGYDNRIQNLREATHAENMQNLREARADSKSGLAGAMWRANRNCWYAQIRTNGKTKWLGHFKTAEEAHEAFLKAKRVLHPFCTV